MDAPCLIHKLKYIWVRYMMLYFELWSVWFMIACKLWGLYVGLEFSWSPSKIVHINYFFQFDRRTFSVAYRFLKAKTPEQRAEVDLDTHYSQVDHIHGFVQYFAPLNSTQCFKSWFTSHWDQNCGYMNHIYL